MRSYTRGKPLTPEEKQFVVSLKGYFDRNRKEFGIQELSTQLVADALQIGLSTVNRIMSDYHKDPESINRIHPIKKGRPPHSIGASNQEIVRAYIREANLEGSHITLETIRDYLNESSADNSFHLTTLSRTLDRWGFEFGKGKRTQHLKEKDSVIVARQQYLRRKRANRLSGKQGIIRPEVYLDESYINKNHSNDYTWYFGEDGPWVQKPTGKGERLIIINAITSNGWVPNAKLVFKSTRKTGDYHGQMNKDLFEKWFTEKLLPNIPSNSLIVMDNATYHNFLSENSAPTPTCSKARIRAWLEANKIYCKDDCLKVELIEVLKKVVPDPYLLQMSG
ncbi:MAG: hypothetical protein ABFQ95_04320 [Pseudomonadota bacterium]